MNRITAGRNKKELHLSREMRERLRCPVTGKPLVLRNGQFETKGHQHLRYPVIDGIPVLINENRSLFTLQDFIERKTTTLHTGSSLLKSVARRLIPAISLNVRAKKNYRTLLGLLPRPAKVLVVGGSIMGFGMEEVYQDASIETIGLDVSFGPLTSVIADGHDIPFEDRTFDGVVIQAVLEHVADPGRCVEETLRILKPEGLVYAETPFMQQVHMGRYDFTRFTHLGHRLLFRHFEEIESGPCCGPGMALSWSFTYFLRSFASTRRGAAFLGAAGQFLSFYLKYFDRWLLRKPGAYDAASVFYFLGKKSDREYGEKEIIKSFRGLA